jgi:hypothetical protein
MQLIQSSQGPLICQKFLRKLKDNLEVKEQSETTDDKATHTKTDKYYKRIINKDSENLDIYQPRCYSSEAVQNASTEQ